MLKVTMKIQPSKTLAMIPIGVLRLFFQKYFRKFEKLWNFEFRIIDLQIESVIV
jgi:hypothetical protein